jgi:hypothetical protein
MMAGFPTESYIRDIEQGAKKAQQIFESFMKSYRV